MKVGIHQPQYLPWLGLIERAALCDAFVILDSVPYSKNYFYNRNRIKTANGWTWLSIPVITKGHFGALIKDIRIDVRSGWHTRHWKSIYYAYKKSPHFEELRAEYEDYFSREYGLLAEASVKSMRLALRQFGVTTRTLLSSELETTGTKEDLLLDICGKLKASTYLSGPDGRDYLRLDRWRERGISVEFQDFSHPKYPQLHSEFLPQMAAIDLLFNCGCAESARILRDKPYGVTELALR